jgi:hypothetical protein
MLAASRWQNNICMTSWPLSLPTAKIKPTLNFGIICATTKLISLCDLLMSITSLNGNLTKVKNHLLHTQRRVNAHYAQFNTLVWMIGSLLFQLLGLAATTTNCYLRVYLQTFLPTSNLVVTTCLLCLNIAELFLVVIMDIENLCWNNIYVCVCVYINK